MCVRMRVCVRACVCVCLCACACMRAGVWIEHVDVNVWGWICVCEILRNNEARTMRGFSFLSRLFMDRPDNVVVDFSIQVHFSNPESGDRRECP